MSVIATAAASVVLSTILHTSPAVCSSRPCRRNGSDSVAMLSMLSDCSARTWSGRDIIRWYTPANDTATSPRTAA